MSGGEPLSPTMSAKNIVYWAMPAVKNRSADASAYALRVGVVLALGPPGELRGHGRVHADRDPAILGVFEGFLDFLADGLPPVDALAPVRDGRLRTGHRLLGLGAVRIDEHLDPADPHLGLRQHGARLQVGDPLFERRHVLEQLLPLELRRLGGSGRVHRDVERRGAVGDHFDVGTPERRQAARHDRDVVAARGQRAEGVCALRIRRGRELRAGRGVGRGDGGVGDRAAGIVSDPPLDAAAMVLHLRHRRLLRRGCPCAGDRGRAQEREHRRETEPSGRGAVQKPTRHRASSFRVKCVRSEPDVNQSNSVHAPEEFLNRYPEEFLNAVDETAESKSAA